MPGLLDFLLGQQNGGGLLGLGSDQPQGGAQPYAPSVPPMNNGYGTAFVNADTGGLLGRLRGTLNQIASPDALQEEYRRQEGLRAGMAMLGALPGGGQPQQQPSSMTPMGAPQAMPPNPSSLPRGIRNNNPLNIEAGPFTQGLPGFTGSDGRFARFAQPQQGIDAASGLLDIYQNQHGLNTVRGIIGRWAPQGENDTNGYVASVAGRMGVSPDQPLTAELRPALIAAMGQFENGRPIPTAQPQGQQPMAMAGGQPMLGADGGIMPPQMAQNGPAALPPNATPTQGGSMSGIPQPVQPQGPPAGSPALNQPGSGLQLVDSPALQGMPDTVRKALPLMFASKQYAPQAMALIQKYINPDQWQMWRDSMGNVFTRNTATGESKPLLTPTPQMMNANASGLSSPLQYEAATSLAGSAAKNTELTPEEKNARASGPMTPAELKAREAQDVDLAKTWTKKYETSVDAGVAARQMLPQLDLAKKVVETDKNFYSGIGEGYNQSLKKIWVAVGGDPNTAAPQELVSKILSGQIVSGLRTAFQGLGQVRVAELNALQNSLAAMKNSPEALKALITMSQKTQQRAADIADIAQSYDNGSGRLNTGFDRAVADYDRKNPVFSQQEINDWKKIAGTPAQPARTVNPYEAEARRRGLIQ